MKGKTTLYNILMTLLLSVFVLALSVSLVLWITPLYTLACRWFHVPEQAGVSLAVCVRNYRALIAYNLPWGPKTLVLPDFVMSEHGRIHFEEVKRIFLTVQYAVPVTGVLLPVGIAAGRIRYRDVEFLRYTVLVVVTIAAAVGAGLLVNSSGAIVLMHRILFRDNYWIFDEAADPVITILPLEVFIAAGAAIIVFAGAMLAGIEALYRHLKSGRRKAFH